jgi:hypothetical protein
MLACSHTFLGALYHPPKPLYDESAFVDRTRAYGEISFGGGAGQNFWRPLTCKIPVRKKFDDLFFSHFSHFS